MSTNINILRTLYHIRQRDGTSYVTYRTEEDAIYITSELYRNTVRLTDHGLQKEFINLTRCGVCAELNTPLTRYLHEQELLVTEEELDHALHQVRSLLDNIFMVTLMPTEAAISAAHIAMKITMRSV